jgi:2-oxoglutarate/2-oxoacid ferredoxin oxidoreductase subunit beta
MVTLADFNARTPDWCPGCGNFGILNALKRALIELNLEPKDVVTVAGIGCSGKTPQWLNTYSIHTLHGRSLPVATGIKLANGELNVIAVGGDGDGYGIGMGHFIHTMRRNIDITYLVFNNMVYGLTTGQTSPTSEKGFVTKSTPFGVIEVPVNPLTLAISTGATYVARGYAGDIVHLSKLIADGIRHKGFAVIDILQPCVSFNRKNTYDWYQKLVRKLPEDYNPSDKRAAMAKAEEWGETTGIPIGVFYKEERPTYSDELPQLATPLVKQGVEGVDVSKLMERLV